MKGTIIGDIVGSRFEFNNHKTKRFELFHSDCRFTDDTVCTIATMDWLATNEEHNYLGYLQKWCKKYPNVGFSPRFIQWILSNSKEPYGSYGNGSAMRVGSVGLYATFEGATLMLAEKTAEVSHNHKEGIKGAKAIAYAIYLAKKTKSKNIIRKEIEDKFTYNLDFPLSYSRRFNTFDATCQVTVPQAITCFLESTSFEDAIRLAVSIGGDTDTICAMTGGIAEAYYGISKDLWTRAEKYLPSEFISVLDRFYYECSKIETEANSYNALRRFSL